MKKYSIFEYRIYAKSMHFIQAIAHFHLFYQTILPLSYLTQPKFR